MTKVKEFLKAGHFPTLVGSFLYFDFSFMIWMLIAALGVFISEEFGLNPAQKGLLVSIPLLGGTLLRIPMGILSDKFGSRKIGLYGMLITMIPLVWGWLFGTTMPEIVIIALFLGVAGSSFAVALPLASRWYPEKYQGLVLGIAGAGNSGSVFATLFAPTIALKFGWHAPFAVALLIISIVLVYFYNFVEDKPGTMSNKKISEYLQIMKSQDALLFCFLYAITFGGFVGLTSFLPIFFHDQYSISKVTTGVYTAYCIIGASMIRPIGGYLADKLGGSNVLIIVLALIGLTLFGASTLPDVSLILPLFIFLMVLFGIGNGSVFQLVPLRFKKDIGIVTGLVGAFGGLGGFFVPNLLGSLKSALGSFTYGLFFMGIIGITGSIALFFFNKFIWSKSSGLDEELLKAI